MSSTGLIAASAGSKVMGRHVIDDATHSVRFDWPAVRLMFEGITGTCTAGIRMKPGRSVFGYSIIAVDSDDDENGEEEILNCIHHILNRVKNIILRTDLDPSKIYNVSIWKRDDPGQGTVQVFGLMVDSDATQVVAQEPVTRRFHLEFVGDSDTVGFGNLGRRSSMMTFLLFQMACLMCNRNLQQATDATKSWPAHIARALDDSTYSIVAWSGIGAKYSYCSCNMIEAYPRILADDCHSTDTANLGGADAVVVYIGQNDLSKLQEELCSFFSHDKLVDGYVELLKVIRQHRPLPIPVIVVVPASDAVVACVSSIKECQKVAEISNQSWNRAVEEVGGNEAGYHLLENRHEPQISLSPKQDFGLMMHWSASSCEKWADGMVPGMKRILSESSSSGTT